MKRPPGAVPCLKPAALTICFTLLSLFACTFLHAQAQNTYRHYQPYDSVFRIIGTNIGNWTVFRELNLDFVREYNPVPFHEIFANTETDTFWTERRRFFRNLLDSGKIIMPVEGMGVNLKTTRVLENYPHANDTLYHNQNFGVVISPERGDSAMHGLTYTLQARGGSPVRRDTLVAGGPRYLSRYLLFYSDTATYRKIGFPDRSTFFRVSAAFRADSLNFPSNPIAPNEILAYFIVYKRTRQNQDSTGCRCQAYVPLDTVHVTKAMYEDDILMPVVDVGGFKEAGITLDFARGYTVMKHDSQYVQIRRYTENGTEKEDTSMLFHRYFYDRDTIVGSVLNERVTRLAVQQIDAERRREMIVRTDSIRLLHVPLGGHHQLDYIYGDRWQWFGWATCDLEECERRARAGDFGPGAIIDHELYESDLNIRFFSTQRAPIAFLRTRVNHDLYDQLRAGKLDSAIIEPSVVKFLSDDTLNRVVGRVAYSDETFFHKYRGDGETARRLQDFLHKHGDTTRQLWYNPIENYYGARVLEEDLDTARLRTLHLICRQDYVGQVGSYDDGIPIFYVNPDTMGAYALDTAYRVIAFNEEKGRLDTFNMVVGHSDSAYQQYNRKRQDMLGSVAESRTTSATHQGALITTLTRAVDAAKFRYRQFGPPVHVWNTIQPMAWRVVQDPADVGLHTGAIFPPWASRPPTAEEVTVQVWLSLNCGVDGIVYTDCQINAENWGFVDEVVGKPRFEYGSWWPAKNFEDRSKEDSLKFAQPQMWTGFISRYNAVKRANEELRLLDSIVHLSDWVHEQKMFEPFDTTMRYADMPLLDTLISERAERAVTKDGGRWIFTPSGQMEPREETWMEISHFTASPRDRVRDAQYLLITNRRCWPIDTKTYREKARSYGAEERGLGAIDVRRPWVRLKDPAFRVMADSLLVEKVGHEDEWPARKVAAGDLLALDWIEPGWGAVYRITPAASGISQYGTAWNNAVHSENPSNDNTERPRVAVFERDSAVYMRALEPNGTWTREWLLSDPADTVTVTVKDPVSGKDTKRRRAHNIFPAFAAQRGNEATGGTSVTRLGGMVVWERRDSLNRASVELVYMNELPSREGDWSTDTSRRRLSKPRPLVPGWKQLIPSVVAVEDRGFVVAWGSPDTIGIELVGVREHPGIRRVPEGDLDIYDTTATVRIYTKVQRMGANGLQWWPADTMCQFPTLAYRRNWTLIDRTGGTKAGAPAPGPGIPVPVDPAAPADTSSYNLVHLAYQQGYRTNEKWEIMYNLVAVDFPHYPTTTPMVPRLWFSQGEHVSNNVTACEHVHPSIATDSGYVAVAWESHLGTSTISLRFRDSIVPAPDPASTAVPIERKRTFWRTPFYRWGDVNPVARANRWTMLRNYTTPSLTHYPGLRVGQLRILPEGALVWQWTNAQGGRRNRQVLYRYGNGGIDTTLEDGADPTMMLRPNAVQSRSRAFTTSSIFRRGSQAEKVTGRSPAGATAFYYPGTIVNSPQYPSTAFSRPVASGTAIVGTYSIIKRTDQLFSPCVAPYAGGAHAGIIIIPTPPTTRRDEDSTPIILRSLPPSTDWGLPPSFFGAEPATAGSVTTLEAAAQVARTSDFTAGSLPVAVHRILSGGDELLSWLNTQSSSSSTPANIMYRTELVRAGDGVVLWASDTTSARRVGNGTLEETITVPVHAWATPGMAVYIRLAAYTTPGLAYDVVAGFEFVEENGYDEGAYKRTRPEDGSIADTSSAIMVALVPNPVHTAEAEVHVYLPDVGTAQIAVYDMLGNRVLTLEDVEAESAGLYAVPVDLGGLRNGLYIVEVRMSGARGTTRFTVMR